MKRYVILLSILLSFMSNMQETISQTLSKLEVMTYTDGQRILVRWIPTDYQTWLSGNEHGYKIERLITHENDTALDFATMQAYRKILFERVKPYSENLWSRLYENDSTYAHIARMILYHDDPAISNPANPTFADAYEIQNNNEIRHLFGLFAADQDFDIARYMALGYEDPCLEGPDFTYQYIISLNNPDTSAKTIKGYSDQIRINTITVLPAVDLSAKSEVKKGVIEWSPPFYESFYGSYDIEKSLDSVNFQQINKMPFVHITEEENPTNIASYADTLAVEETAYYRIVGRTPFGIKGPYSNVVTATGRPERMPIFISVDTVSYNLSDSQATVEWSDFDITWQDSINGFNVYQSDYSNSGFEKITNSILPVGARSFDLQPALISQYVKIQVIDMNGYSYFSPSVLVQPADHIPPDAPQMLTGVYLNENRIELIWQQNSEPDLQGYRVFMANSRAKTWVQITNAIIATPIYYYDVEEEMEVDSIYFKIYATDFRQNNSEFSEVLALVRPDIIPPSPPNLYRVEPGLNGVEIAWRFSESDDRTRHVLQRKLINTPLWVDVIEVLKNDESNHVTNLTPNGPSETLFLDDDTLNIMEYQYRMLAYDDNENMSGSEVKKVTPYDPGLRGVVDSVVAYVQYFATSNTIPDTLLFAMTSNTIASYYITDTLLADSLRILEDNDIITTAELNDLLNMSSADAVEFLILRLHELWGDYIDVRVVVQWHYNKLHALDKFELHRGIDSSAVQLYESFDAAPMHYHRFYDDDVKSNWVCEYSILALHSDGGFSNMSPTITITLPIN